jgi:hypothetical protein
MILDNNLVFSNGQAITGTTASAASYDMAGGATTASFVYGNASRFGEDLGIGDGVAMPKVCAYIGTAPLTTNSATLQIAFQGSTDSSNWDTYVETRAIPATALSAGTKVAAFDWPPKAAGFSLPRYVRLYYTVGTGAFTTGTIFAAIGLQRDDWVPGAANYTAV